MAKKKSAVAKYWGYLLFIPLYLGWFKLGWDPTLLAALSGLIVLYGLFQAPVPCCAITREGLLCRRNAKGLLRGCHLEQHRWQNARLLVRRSSWGRLAGNIFRSIAGNAAALTVVVGLLSVVASLVTPFITKSLG